MFQPKSPVAAFSSRPQRNIWMNSSWITVSRRLPTVCRWVRVYVRLCVVICADKSGAGDVTLRF